MRSAAHEIEDALGQVYVPKAQTLLLTIRRTEKDYLLRGDKKYAEATHNAVAALLAAFKEARISQHHIDNTDAELKAYQEAFDALVAEDKKITTLTAAMRAAVHQIEPEVDDLHNTAMEAATVKTAAITTAALSNARRAIGSGIAAILLGILFSFFVIREVLNLLGADPSVVADIAQRVAVGDLTVEFNTRGKAAKGVMAAMQTMVIKLNEVVTTVKNGAMNVAAGNEEMSQGASEQASAIEEASASMEEIAANIRQNADNAAQTEKIAIQAAESARKSRGAIAETVKAIQEIAQRISIVEEIARQTHTLSLNATIEAAKAQQYGKGFAVVASEVRALAERSRVAAAKINQLASSSVAVSEKAGEMLAKLVPDIRKTSELVQEISAASREQNSGAGQINGAIQQLDQVIQQNASVAEELSSQTEQLQNTIKFFNINGTGRKTRNDGQQHVQGAVLTEPATDMQAKTTHLKSHNDDKTIGEAWDGKASVGYAINLKQDRKAGDDQDAEFERF